MMTFLTGRALANLQNSINHTKIEGFLEKFSSIKKLAQLVRREDWVMG
jgi:hypothetical protein